ncbi:hypothetical protein M2352_000205 [Azospirillum fermentarium]|uniref:hypothetical protein n=1 Tax=Azospirillum fermentarium TaxID=1233114 RepID=UPI002225DB8E|nr:hypothetical protein [Azospirillum fermentarium]MCW2244614.1 hypothetical protein [Azospirillum fermentarium]
MSEMVKGLLLFLFLSGAGFGLARLVVFLGERSIERRYGVTGVRMLIAERATLEQRMEMRRAGREEELSSLDGEIHSLVRRKEKLDRRTGEVARYGKSIVRQIGEEVKGCPCYIAHVANKYVGADKGPHAMIDSSWAKPQAVEVWAPNVPEARRAIERRYPPTFGYVVTRIQPMGDVFAGDGPVG